MAGWGSLSSNQRINVVLTVRGGPAYDRTMASGAAANARFTRSLNAANVSMRAATEQSFLLRQGIFTLRRYMFYGTLAITGMAVGIARLGMNFYTTMQQAKVAFAGFIPGTQAVNRELRQLYVLAAKTPFEFPDIVQATRRLMPFVKNLQLTNQVVESIVNSLSAAGLVGAQYINRASLALAHMFSMGRLTGQVLNQLNRDNIPMTQALEKAYHATGMEIKTAVSQGLISAADAAKALNYYIRTTPGFAKAAAAQSRTLVGAWATFKDMLGMAAGSSESGLFSGLTKSLNAVNDALFKASSGGRALSMVNVVKAIDQQLTPTSHGILNAFTLINTVVRTVIGTFLVLFKVISIILWPFNKLFNLFGAGTKTAQILGYVIGILTGIFLFERGVILLTVLAVDAYKISMLLLRPVILAVTGAQKLYTLLMKGEALQAIWRYLFAEKALNKEYRVGILARNAQGGKLLWLKNIFIGIGVAVKGVIIQVRALGAALWALVLDNPIGLIAAAIVLVIGGLVILYFKWKRFHDLVNRTAKVIFRAAKWVVQHTGYVPPAMHHHATGGMVAGGISLVGERGPELVQLPGGSRITPDYGVQSVPMNAVTTAGHSDRPIIVQVMLDRKVLAEGVARANQDYAARR